MKILKDQALHHLNTATSYIKIKENATLESQLERNVKAEKEIKAALAILAKL